MARKIGAGIAGVVIAFSIVMIVELIGHTVYPVPPELDYTDTEAFAQYVAGLPFGAFLFVGGAWFLGTLCGTFAAAQIGTARPLTYAMIIGGLMLAATAYNLVVIPHPLWFSIAGVAGIIVAAWLGAFFAGGAPESSEN